LQPQPNESIRTHARTPVPVSVLWPRQQQQARDHPPSPRASPFAPQWGPVRRNGPGSEATTLCVWLVAASGTLLCWAKQPPSCPTAQQRALCACAANVWEKLSGATVDSCQGRYINSSVIACRLVTLVVYVVFRSRTTWAISVPLRRTDVLPTATRRRADAWGRRTYPGAAWIQHFVSSLRLLVTAAASVPPRSPPAARSGKLLTTPTHHRHQGQSSLAAQVSLRGDPSTRPAFLAPHFFVISAHTKAHARAPHLTFFQPSTDTHDSATHTNNKQSTP
jgi:hypothetical protein